MTSRFDQLIFWNTQEFIFIIREILNSISHYLLKPKTNNMKKAFAYRGAEAWNNLSTAMKSAKSISLALKPK